MRWSIADRIADSLALLAESKAWLEAAPG